MKSTILAVSGFIASVSAHGLLVSPAPRQPGAAHRASCGAQANYQDKNGNIQGVLQVARQQSDYNPATCNLWLCKGWKYEDNTANVQTYTAGQVVPVVFNVAAPHTGVANFSIVDTATNTIIGSPLKSWTDFASNAHTIPDDQKSFSVTIPSDPGSKCSTAGACVLQHFWDARNIDQTYESCIDFTVGGGSGGGAPAPAPSSAAPVPSSAAPAPCSSTLVTITKVAEPTSSAAAPSATPTGTGSGGSTKPIPEGVTLEDLLAWIKILLNGA